MKQSGSRPAGKPVVPQPRHRASLRRPGLEAGTRGASPPTVRARDPTTRASSPAIAYPGTCAYIGGVMNETLPIAEATEIAATPAAAAPVVRIGVLLVNLGTPDAADADSVRRYLKEFLSDPRVIENQGLAWKAILNGAILRFRPRRKARDYAKIWNRETNESPL